MEHALHPCPATRSLSPWRSSIDSRGGPRGDHDGHERRASVYPFGSGAHPYLTLGTETVDSVILRAPRRTVLRSDERGIPVGAASVEGSDYDFRRPRTIGATKLDSAFTDLERDDDGLARVQLRDPRRGSEPDPLGRRELSVPRAVHRRPASRHRPAQPRGRAMTCPPNAFQTGKDLIRLEPGQSFTGKWGIRPS